MLKEINQDILEIKEGIIVHQTNCVLYSYQCGGLAKAIFAKWPEVARVYNNHLKENYLGDCMVVKLNDKFMIANLYGQYLPLSYDKSVGGTDYKAVISSLKALKEWVINSSLPLYFPYKIGCGMGGGDWDKYKTIIEEIFPEAIICLKS